ncbi:UDP-GalNAc:beta-1,3-N-acetylgalactosaminyltransferase 2-like [Oppia nitens]|uniref:UDP-GalNAc:beta-1, 3-N-acetylgalactosaminyltransferase 2-like n=1 Tax=Oppia nitens TaxID=1686743 RepID=UPI0023DC5349|nr:UDP-GalNAc:beta-1,3-N-acetylgalactosaminyltransferase 2-like [Oppia nitens]
MVSNNYCLVYVIISSIIICLFSYFVVVLVNDQSLDIFDNNYHKCSLNIFIAILSQRSHFDKRQTLRQTWIQTIDEINRNNSLIISSNRQLCDIKVTAKFIIGHKDCPIHRLYRQNDYNCHYNELLMTETANDINLQEVHHFADRSPSDTQIFRGLSFVIRHTIVVTKLGIHKTFLNDYQNITIVLLNAANKDIIVSKNISIKSINFNNNYYETIEPIVLAKDFYGLLIIDNQLMTFDDNNQINITYNQNGFIHILRAYYGFTDFESISYNPQLIIGPTFTYKVFDIKAIELLINSQNETQIQWTNELIRTEKSLAQEIAVNNDILVVETIDVYRNLVEKVIQSLQFTIEFFNGLTHFVKTDDDCYLNIINIIKELIENNRMKNVWFGNFRRVWPLDYWGKWAENEYESPIYPTFACGSGYVLSSDLVKWISYNTHYLHRFQGEDVSMGIWLSAIKPIYKDDKRWFCNNSQINMSHGFSFPQLDKQQIIKIHKFISNRNKNT